MSCLGARVPARWLSTVVAAACAWMVVAAIPGSAGAKFSCRTVVVHATDNNDIPKTRASVRVHRCERIKVEFVFATQGQLVYLWQVTREPAKKVLKLRGSGYGPSTSDTGTQIWTYEAVGRGKTSVTFGDFTPSYPNQPAADTFKLTVTVR